jgi:sortase B
MKNIFNKSTYKNIWESFYDSYIPTKRDNLTQIILKSTFLLIIVLLIFLFVFVASYFTAISAEQNMFLENKQVFQQLSSGNQKNYVNALKYFKKQNSDLKGWISIKNTSLASPVYQAKDNKFYLNHNQLKEKSSFGALFFDYKDSVVTETIDKNFVIYGNSPKSDQLFSCLKNYKSLYFYKKNPYISLSTMQGTEKYVIFATFIINSDRKDDGNYIFDYKRSNFEDSDSFTLWYNELRQRSLYLPTVNVTNEDSFLTLVTDSVEFEGAKLVVMARKVSLDETIDISKTVINKKPRYPSIYYNIKKIKNPFDI